MKQVEINIVLRSKDRLIALTGIREGTAESKRKIMRAEFSIQGQVKNPCQQDKKKRERISCHNVKRGL
jgi:hypothetical protein